MAAKRDPYARVWADHRALLLIGLATLVALPLPVLLVGVTLGPFLDGQGPFAADAFALVVGSVVWAVLFLPRACALRCPACHGPFQGPWRLRRRRCRQCGLPFGGPRSPGDAARNASSAT
jgi:hypothetical protein